MAEAAQIDLVNSASKQMRSLSDGLDQVAKCSSKRSLLFSPNLTEQEKQEESKMAEVPEGQLPELKIIDIVQFLFRRENQKVLEAISKEEAQLKAKADAGAAKAKPQKEPAKA